MGPRETGRLRAADGRLRAWLRILVVVVLFVLATTAAAAVGNLVGPLAARFTASGVAVLVVTAVLFAVFARRLDRRRVRSYGLAIDGRWWLDLVVGAVIGLLVGGVALLWFLAAGYAQITEVFSAGTEEALWTGLLAAVVFLVAVAVWEELVFRGYVMSNAAEALVATRRPANAVILAWLISIPLFAVGHFGQFLGSEAGVVLAFAFFVFAGALLGLAYAFTGQLGLPIGIHLTVNLGMTRIFPVAPPEETEPIAVVYRVALDGPGWIVGVGGMAQIAGIGVALAALWLWVKVRPGAIAVDEAIAVRSDDEWVTAS